MKNAALLVCVLLSATYLPALDAYPKTSIAEDMTATWCPSCPAAFDGLDVLHTEFDHSQFVSVRYYATSGDYGTAETNARISYYGTRFFPTVFIDGTRKYVGTGSTTATTGEPFKSGLIEANLVPAPVKITIDSFDPISGDISVTVTMHSTTAVLDTDKLVLVLVEDDLGWTSFPDPVAYHTHATRDIIYETISLDGEGDSETFSASFNMNPGWVTANLNAVALVQYAGTRSFAPREVLQVASTRPQPDYSVRAMVPFSRVDYVPFPGTSSSDDFTVMNVGLADSYSIDLVVDDAPPGWQVEFVDEFGGIHTNSYNFGLDHDASTEFHVNVIPNSSGQIKFHLAVTSTSNPATPITVPFTYYTDDIKIMLVDDDGGETFEDYFMAALDTAGKAYGVWNRDAAGALPTVVSEKSEVLIWNGGWTSTTFDDDDQVFVAAHLDAGNSLFVTGQDIGWEMNDPDASPPPSASIWYQTYLKAIYERDDTNILDLDGVPGDLLTDGLDLHIAGGDGANNQAYPDEIAAADTDATLILNYRGDGGGAIRSTDSVSGAKVIYLGFGFEAIDNAQDRYDLLIPSVNWLQGIIFVDGFESSDTTKWSNTEP